MSKNPSDFEEIEEKFWKNINKIHQLEVGTPERLELIEESNNLLKQLK